LYRKQQKLHWLQGYLFLIIAARRRIVICMWSYWCIRYLKHYLIINCFMIINLSTLYDTTMNNRQPWVQSNDVFSLVLQLLFRNRHLQNLFKGYVYFTVLYQIPCLCLCIKKQENIIVRQGSWSASIFLFHHWKPWRA
jgi:hypothetical protein